MLVNWGVFDAGSADGRIVIDDCSSEPARLDALFQ